MNTLISDLLRSKGFVVETIEPSATVLDAIRKMRECRIGCLVVVSKSGKVSGLLSERDCLWRSIADGLSPRKMLVKEAMTPVRKLTTVTLTHTVDDCMNLMTTGRHRHLPVLKGTTLAGLISIGDVVKFLLGDQQATIQSLEKYIEGSL